MTYVRSISRLPTPPNGRAIDHVAVRVNKLDNPVGGKPGSQGRCKFLGDSESTDVRRTTRDTLGTCQDPGLQDRKSVV